MNSLVYEFRELRAAHRNFEKCKNRVASTLVANREIPSLFINDASKVTVSDWGAPSSLNEDVSNNIVPETEDNATYRSSENNNELNDEEADIAGEKLEDEKISVLEEELKTIMKMNKLTKLTKLMKLMKLMKLKKSDDEHC